MQESKINSHRQHYCFIMKQEMEWGLEMMVDLNFRSGGEGAGLQGYQSNAQVCI